MATDEHERTWLALTLPSVDGTSLPLDATIMAPPAADRPAPLPHISLGEEPAAAGARAASGTADLVVLRLLGEGGMGRVQLARQRSLDREVALKRPRDGASDADAALLRAEALVTGHLEHPNIIPVHALGVDDRGRPLIVMKRVDGVAWRDLLRDPEHPGWATREPDPAARLVWHLGILAQLCNAIAFAHSRGIVHRDMKPDNVMVGEFGEVYLIDWGVAVEAGARPRGADGKPVLAGTPAYMAPEMVSGGPVDRQTDVYLLGATLHEIVTGRVRHDGPDLRAVALQALASAPFDYGPAVPDELAELANRACAADPAARPSGALAFRQALLEHLRHRGSLRLSADADRALAAIEAAPAAADARAIEECRFGYREALREWPDNPDALRGLRRSALASARLELGRKNPLAARAALIDVADPPADLAAAIARLEEELAAEEAERDRLRALERDADPMLGSGTRIRLLGLLFVVATLVSAFAVHLQRRGAIDAASLIALPSFIALASAAFILAFRRKVMVNAFSRRMAIWFQVMILSLVLSRILGRAIHLTVPQQFVVDGLLYTSYIATGGILLYRWAWWCAGVALTGTIIGVLVPSAALISFAVGTSLVIVISALFLLRPGR